MRQDNQRLAFWERVDCFLLPGTTKVACGTGHHVLIRDFTSLSAQRRRKFSMPKGGGIYSHRK